MHLDARQRTKQHSWGVFFKVVPFHDCHSRLTVVRATVAFKLVRLEGTLTPPLMAASSTRALLDESTLRLWPCVMALARFLAAKLG